MAQHAETEYIYKRIALEAFVEVNFATNGRHADAVAVMRDAGCGGLPRFVNVDLVDYAARSALPYFGTWRRVSLHR